MRSGSTMRCEFRGEGSNPLRPLFIWVRWVHHALRTTSRKPASRPFWETQTHASFRDDHALQSNSHYIVACRGVRVFGPPLIAIVNSYVRARPRP